MQFLSSLLVLMTIGTITIISINYILDKYFPIPIYEVWYNEKKNLLTIYDATHKKLSIDGTKVTSEELTSLGYIKIGNL